MVAKYTFKCTAKRSYHRNSTMSKAEIMLLKILFHDSNYRCLKHFYREHVCKHLRHLFPKVVSYNRFVEFEREIAVPQALFIKKLLILTRDIFIVKKYRLFLLFVNFGLKS